VTATSKKHFQQGELPLAEGDPCSELFIVATERFVFSNFHPLAANR